MSERYGSTNLSQGSLFGITRHCRVMPNSDPRDRFVDPYLSLMVDSFSCTLFCAKAWINYNFTLRYATHSRPPFFLTSFYGALVTCVSDHVTWRPLQPILNTGPEHQDQNIRVRPVFLTLAKTLDVLVFYHEVCENKFSNTRKLCCELPKIQTKRPNHRIFCQNRRWKWNSKQWRPWSDCSSRSSLPDQTAPLGAVWSGSALFAQTYLSENLRSSR